MKQKHVWMATMMTMPRTGAPHRLTFAKHFGKKPSTADCWNTLAIVNCQPSVEPAQERIKRNVTNLPIVELNIKLKVSPNGALDFTSSVFGTMPAMMLVDAI